MPGWSFFVETEQFIKEENVVENEKGLIEEG